MKFILTAGGQGTKIWPFSRKTQPKQFQKIIGDQSLLTTNVKMLLRKYKPEDIFISTKKMYAHFIKEQAPEIPEENLIFEPDAAKNRGPAEGFAFLVLSLKCPKEPFTLIQADCLYLPTSRYLKMVGIIEDLLRKEKKFISGGLTPNFPVLGVDYLELGKEISDKGGVHVYQVRKFVDRVNDYNKTEEMIQKKNVVIYTNISSWYPDLMLNAYKKYRPDWYQSLQKIKEVLLSSREDDREIDRIYEDMEAGSTEDVTRHILPEGYAVMLPFKWVDIGTWDSVYKHLSKDNGVHKEGNVVALDSIGTLVKSTNKEKLVAILGLKDMVVVDTQDILFIAPRDKVSSIGDVHAKLREEGLEDFL